MPNQSEPQHVLSLATFSGHDAKQGLAGVFSCLPADPRDETHRSGDRSSGVLTKVKPPEQNPRQYRVLMMTPFFFFFKGFVTAQGQVDSHSVNGCIVGRCRHMQRTP